MEENSARTGFPKEAWAAIGVIGAAIVTGAVTVLVNIIQSDDDPPEPTTATTSSTSTSNSPVAGMIGEWEGTAKTSDGSTFQVALEIDRACQVGQLCGAISVPDVPCHGQIFLNGEGNGEVEFRVANFNEQSDQEVCKEGAGEHFRLLPDGQLAYRTTYEPIAQGILNKR